jgi:DNA-binding transcriptional ArsR family regulator
MDSMYPSIATQLYSCATVGLCREPTLPHPLPESLAELIAQRFRVLGDPLRIKLLDRLRLGEATVQELTEASGSSQQNVSKHLRVLLAAGVVRRRQEGNFARYAVADEGVFALCDEVCGGLRRQLDGLDSRLGGAA